MRTSFVYTVSKEEYFDYKTESCKERIFARTFEFFVSGAKSKEEHMALISDFQNFLEENGYRPDGFGHGSWEDCKRLNDTKNYDYLMIAVNDMDEKEELRELYKEWKKRRKGNK